VRLTPTSAAAQRAVVPATKCSIRRPCFAGLNRLFLIPSLITPHGVIWDSPKRNNETGLEILDSYEERWAESESLSDRQIAWLEKQLSWGRRGGGSSPKPDAAAVVDPRTDNDGGAAVERVPDIIRFPAIDRNLEQRIDAMISRKLQGPGKTVVDLRRLDELEQAIDGLMRAVRAMR